MIDYKSRGFAVDKLVVDEWILDHSGLLCAIFALIYLAAVVLIPIGLARGYVPMIYFGEICLLILVALLVISEPLDEWRLGRIASPLLPIIRKKEKIRLLQVYNYAAQIALILPAMLFVAFLVVATSRTPLPYVIATGGYFELAYLFFIPAWRHYVQKFVGMNLMFSASSFASLAHLYLSRSQKVGLDYFRRALHDYQRYLLQNGVTNKTLTALDTMILSFKAILSFKTIPFRELAQLASHLSRLGNYSRFSEAMLRFQSRYRWVNDLDLAPRNPSWVGRNAMVALTVLGLIAALTVTEPLRTQIYAILTEATTGGLSQLVFAMVVYLGTALVMSRATALFSRRIPRSHIAEFRESG